MQGVIGLVSVFGEKSGLGKSDLTEVVQDECFLLLIPHSRPTISEQDIKAVADVLASGRISMGEKVEEFEEAVARYVGTKCGVAVSSGTAALHLALLGLGVGLGDEVIIPSFVCSSLYFAVKHVGGVPKIADVDSQDLNVSAEGVRRLIGSKTKAVVVPHMFGMPAELDEMLELGVPIIEDCAQSLGAEYRGRKVGGFGVVSILSFYATKVITSGEGGMVLTGDEDLCSRISDLREYDKKALTPVKYNYKMADFQAALGLSQLSRLDDFILRRRRVASEYGQFLSRFRVKLPSERAHKNSVFYRYVIMVDELEKIQTALKKNGVMCERPVFQPLHRGLTSFKCPNSDLAYDHALSIPIYPMLSEEEIEYVFHVFDEFMPRN